MACVRWGARAAAATVFVAALMGFSRPAAAVDYYVATTGNNANSGTSAQPWRTVAYAVSSSSPARAGDTIYVRAGVYAEYVPMQKSGSVGSPITLRAYPGDARPVLTTGGQFGNIFFSGQTNWTIDGFEIRDSSGGAGIYFDDGGSSTGTVQILNNRIHNTDSGDNASCIFVQRQLGTFIFRNNVLYDCNGTNAGNSTGIVVFGHINTGHPGDITIRIQNNEIYNEGVGIKIKHPFASDQRVTIDISYNLLHDLYSKGAISVAGGKFTSGKTHRIHHNVIYNGTTTPALEVGDDFDEYGVEIDHNTVYNMGHGFVMCLMDGCGNGGSRDVNLHDNVLVPRSLSGDNGFAIWTEVTTSPFTNSDYNCFWNVSPTTVVANWGGYGGGVDQTLAQWQGRGFDARSTRADPQFVNPSGVNFRLGSSSACKNLRGNGTDPGAYETGSEVIGPSGTAPPTMPAPAAPTNLRILR